MQKAFYLRKSFYAGIAFWACAAGAVYCLRPKSRIHAAAMAEPFDRRKRIATLLVMLAVMLLCTLPMSLSPVYNGTSPVQRDQYEKITEAFLDGHLYFDYEADPRLLALENPYDPAAREGLDSASDYHWDHAFYNGRYYMYFGVVPVFLLFMPFRLLTGTSLTTYHATQIFVAAFIGGVFAIFYLLCRRFFRSMTFAAYLALSAAFSVMSVWYCTAAPALYCTAISSALCMEVWSLYCFMRAVWVEADTRRSLRRAFFGSLFGALAFGCRPPVALANLLVLPLLAEYLRTPPRKRFRDLALAAAPYVVVAALLMVYNYLRFDSPFEFGQSYQLTGADQSGYGILGRDIGVWELLRTIAEQLFRPMRFTSAFPYLSFQSFFGNFPILLFSLCPLLVRGLRAILKKHRLWHFYLAAMAVCVLIMGSNIIYAPTFSERYRTDSYWLMALITFIAFGCLFEKLAEARASGGGPAALASSCVCLCSLLTVAASILFFLIPFDYNYTYFFPDILKSFQRVLQVINFD